MRIGLVDVDGRNFPNLALMKLSAWHKAQGDAVEWWNGFTHYNRVYLPSGQSTMNRHSVQSMDILPPWRTLIFCAVTRPRASSACP